MKKSTVRIKRIFSFLCILVVFITSFTLITHAEGNEAFEAVNRLQSFLFTIVQGIGIIIVLFAIVNIGISIKSHDPSQRANALLTLAGGLLILFSKQILDLITGGL